MGLGRKNLTYSLALAGVMLLFLVGYFVYMLPSLYVDYVMEQNLQSIREQHNSYIKNGTYEGVQVKNSTACFSVEIPMDGNSILITGKAFSAEVVITDGQLENVLSRIREKFADFDGNDFRGEIVSGKGENAEKMPEMGLDKDFGELAEIFRKALQADSLPIDVRLVYSRDMEEEFGNERIKFHSYSDNMVVIEAGIEDSNNKYTNYTAIERTKDSLVFSFLPVVTPEMDEIRPIVLQSLPMLGAVILLAVLLFSQIYSKGIVSPIVELVQHTQHMKNALEKEYAMGKEAVAEAGYAMGREAAAEAGYTMGKKPAAVIGCAMEKGAVAEAGHAIQDGYVGNKRYGEYAGGKGDMTRKKFTKILLAGWFSGKGADKKDEVQQLSDILEDFYAQIKESCRRLEEANEELEEENKRQEIFLRASSHQLKTPIAAALLLVDGMMNEIGRYKDTKVYLPKVKEQLLSMRKMVEDILYLNHCAEEIQCRETELGRLLREKLQCYQVAIAEKQLSVGFAGNEDLAVCTDERMIGQIVDNLLSNAVKYTPAGGRIEIALCEKEAGKEIRIENFGVSVSEELLPHIFEPFVSGNYGEESRASGSHGLGLYIASYYAKKLKVSLSVYNGENSVVSILKFAI